MALEFVRDIPSYCEVFEIKRWYEYIEHGFFNDYDGCGNFAKDGKMTRWGDDVCNIMEIDKAFLEGATHVCWFSK